MEENKTPFGDDATLLEAYLFGYLSDSEKDALEVRLAVEPNLYAQFQDLQLVHQSLMAWRLAKVKAEMLDWEKEMDEPYLLQQTPTPGARDILCGAITLLVLFLFVLCLYWLRPSVLTGGTDASKGDKFLAPPKGQGTVSPKENDVSKGQGGLSLEEKVIAEKTPDPPKTLEPIARDFSFRPVELEKAQRLAKDNFMPPTLEEYLSPDHKSYTSLKKYYQDQKFVLLAKEFDRMDDPSKAYKYKLAAAVFFLADGEPRKAIERLKPLTVTIEAEAAIQRRAKWHLALSYLFVGRSKDAHAELLGLAQTDGDYKIEAADLLEQF